MFFDGGSSSRLPFFFKGKGLRLSVSISTH
jgi:hypothetical protein